MRRKAFTLVELLVVIGIIAVLIAILLPALSAARKSAQSLACEANLRTLGQALIMHANEHKGYMPLAGNISVGGGIDPNDNPQGLGDGAMAKYDYYPDTHGMMLMPMPDALAPYLGVAQVSSNWNAMETALLTGVYRTAFQCPSDDYNALQTSYSPAPLWINSSANTFVGWSSYGYNTDVFGWYSGYPWNRLHGNLAAIPNPAETMLLMDVSLVAVVANHQQGQGSLEIWTTVANSSLADAYMENASGSPPCSVPNNIFDLLRHRGRINILCADGHVESDPILANGGTTTNGNAVGTGANIPSGYLPPSSGLWPGQPVSGGGSLGGISLNKGFIKGGNPS